MNMRQVVASNPVLAIMRNVPLENTVPYVQAIVDGGVRFFEVALNTPHALEQIALIRAHFKDEVLLGAGTAITVELTKSAIAAGAEFLLAPSADDEVLAYCQEQGIAMLPGALTPSEVTRCMRYGFDTIKLFPAGDMPPSYVKSLKGPLDQTEYVAIGGVTAENFEDYFRAGFIGVGMGGNLLPKAAVAAGDFAACSRHIADMLARIHLIQHERKQ